MLMSRASCSIIFVIESVTRKTRLEASATSTAGPSPLAVTRVSAGTRIRSDTELVMAGNSNKSQNSFRFQVSSLEYIRVASDPPNWSKLEARNSKLIYANLLGFAGMGRGEVAAAGLLGGLELHKIYARQVRIEDIQLPLAVASHLRMFIAMLFPAVRFQNRLRLLHIGNTVGDVIHDSGESKVRMSGLIQHVLQPVGAIGNLQRNPVGLVVLHAAVPVGTEAQNLAIEMVGGGAVVNEKAGVDHAPRDRIRFCRHALILRPLHEFDVVALRIVHDKAEAVVGTALNLAGLEPLLGEVATQACNVIGRKRHMVHAVSGFWIRSEE